MTNGETAIVERVDKGGSIHLTDGRMLPPGFRQFTYGYAVTAHRSQGKSVDSVIISGDGMQKELFYVAASRGRKSVLVVTSDKELLRETVGWSSARQSASDLSRKGRPGLLQGQFRRLEAARRLQCARLSACTNQSRGRSCGDLWDRTPEWSKLMSTTYPDKPRAWEVTMSERPTMLEINLAERTYVLPWSQFLFAEGDGSEVRLAYSTHDIVVAGTRLEALLKDLTAQRVDRLQESARAEGIGSSSVPRISRISLRKID